MGLRMNFAKSQPIRIWVVPNIDLLVTDLGCQVGSLLFVIWDFLWGLDSKIGKFGILL